MRLSLTLLLFLVAGLLNPISTSLSGPPEDSEGSGYDLDSSGSGSGEESERAEEENGKVQNQPDSEDGKSFEDFSVQTFDSAPFPGGYPESELVLLGKPKSFLDNKDALAAVIAGGVIGGALAAAVTAIMIYKWLKKDGEEQSQGLWKTSDEGYRKPIREEYII